MPVSPFVVVTVPGTTRWHTTRASTALPTHRSAAPRTSARGAYRLLLGPLSQTSAFEPPARQRQAPGTNPAAKVLPALVILVTLRVSWLSGVTPRVRQVICPGFRRGIVSALMRFQGTESGSFPLPFRPGRFAATPPLSDRRSLLGIDSLSADRQALTGLSWLSYSWPLICSGPRTRHGPAPRIATLVTPHAGSRCSLPEGGGPRGWICGHKAHAPTSRDDGSWLFKNPRAFLHRPASKELHRIELQDYATPIQRE
jgi:hypothetical protein